MIEDTRQRGAQACGPACGPRPGPTPMCSMAACAGMLGKPPSGLLLALPGAASVLAGVALLVMAGFVRRLRARPPA